MFSFAIAPVIFAGFLGTAATAEGESAKPRRAYAQGNDKITIISEATLESLGTIALPEGHTEFWWNNAEKNRLAILIENGYLGNKSLALVVIDLDADKIVNTVQLGYNVERYSTSDDGNRGYIVLGGKLRKGKPSLVMVDTMSGTILAQAELADEPDDFFLNDGGGGVILVEGGLNALKPKYREPATLELLDGETLESRKKVTLPGSVTGIYVDYPGRLHLLNRGVDVTDKDERLQGVIYVVDREDLELKATLEVGMAPAQLAWDEQREIYYLLTSPWATKKQAEAQLHLVGGDAIEASIDLPRRPLAVQPSLDREHFYVLYKDTVVRVDRNLEGAKEMLRLKEPPVQLFEHPDNGYFYVLHYDSPEVSVVNGATGKTVDTIKSGRTSKRIGKFATAVGAQLAVAGLVVASGPSFTVGGTAYYNVPIVNIYDAEYQRTFAAFSEDATLLYVYNLSTDDVTVIDTKSNEVVAKIAGGEEQFYPVAGGRLMCTVDGSNVRFFDMQAGWEEKAEYSGYAPSFVEIPSANKAFLSQDLGKPVSVIDLEKLGELTQIPDTSGHVLHLMDYE
jgi:YVTN family beta-propeller protein